MLSYNSCTRHSSLHGDPATMKELEFSTKYDANHSENYFFKHKRGLRHRLTTRREMSLARKALEIAGNPRRILDLPCGAGRFWSMLGEDPERTLFAADNSQDMVDTAKRLQDKEIADRFQCFQTSAFSIDMPDLSVDNIFCMRLLHHITEESDRLAVLKEFYRVTKDTVCLSMWADGNIQYRRRKRNEAKRPAARVKNRIAITAKQAESEYREAGFRIVDYLDLIPGMSMWRLYILKKGN